MHYANVVLWIIYIITVIIGVEIFAYIWHRYGAHCDYIPGVHNTHRIHHESNLNVNHEANEDFIWIMIILIISELMTGISVMMEIVNDKMAIIGIIVGLLSFWWNWWIHRAYHQPDHWLLSYEWFREEKKHHYIHHYHPDKNYGIASHFIDKIMGSWCGE